MAGYNSNHSQYIQVYVATNNDDYLSQGNPDWTNSGRDWGNLVNSISDSGYCGIAGGNDIENWADGSFQTYGNDTYNWCVAYNGATSKEMLNYGDQCAAVNPNTWTENEVFLVSYGLADDYVMPEIYYTVNAGQWQSIYNSVNGGMFFKGTMSEYGAGGSIGWLTAWQDLNDVVTNAVGSSATNI